MTTELKEQQSHKYHIDWVARNITALEKKGRDATHERECLKAWAKLPGWEYAGEVFNKLSGRPLEYAPLPTKSTTRILKQGTKEIIPTPKKNKAVTHDVSKLETRHLGRPRKKKALSRTTLWRRQKEKQARLGVATLLDQGEKARPEIKEAIRKKERKDG